METDRILDPALAPINMQRAVKVALTVGAQAALNADRDSLFVQFKDADRYPFDPDNVTLHCLELVGVAVKHGFVFCRHDPNDAATPWKWGRQPLVVRTVFSQSDVRVQIGTSKWFMTELHTVRDTAVALRRSTIDAFVAYYDEAIRPYPKA